jgi:hypothetical protein
MKLGALALCLLVALSVPRNATAHIVDNTTKTDKSCPIELHGFGEVLAAQNVLGNFELRFKNQSGKGIMGATFGIEIMDAVGDFHATLRGIDFVGNPAKVLT